MNCDPLARWYRWLEYAGFGRALERRRREFLPMLGAARRVLMLGEGDGRFLAAFLRGNPRAEVDYVDSSRKMLALARGRAIAAGSGPRVRFHHADAFAWLRSNPPGGYDLVCTHFFLDCFATLEVEMLAGEIARHTTSPARWIVSEFSCPYDGWNGWVARKYIRLLYAFFGVFTGLKARRLPDHAMALRAAGFQLAEGRIAALGLLVSERWERDPGTGSAAPSPTGFCV